MTANTISAPREGTEVALSAADHVVGNANAEHTLLEYGDFECPSCMRVEPLVRRLVDNNAKRLRFVFRHFPLVALHPHAELAAEAAEAAAAQGRFWPMHRLLFAQAHHLAMPALTGYAESIGLDMIRFKAEMADRIYTQRVQEHRRAGELSGVRVTPTFFLDDKAVDVASGFARLEHAVDVALRQ